MIRKLIEHFSCHTILPIDIADVVAHIREAGVKDHINFYPVEIDPLIVRGFIHQYTMTGKPYQGDIEYADIYYAKSMPPHWKQLTQCKELLHVLDDVGGRTKTVVEVARLITEVVKPIEISAWSPATTNDHITLFWALAILFPKDARDMLKPAYDAGKISAMDIAKLVLLPARYIPFIMDDSYDEVYKALLEAAP